METYNSNPQQSFRERLSWKIAYALKPLYFALRRKRRKWEITKQELLNMDKGSLGRELGDFLQRHNLDLMPRAEWHDVYHVLFNYETNIKDEACVQFVPLGNGRISLPYVACTAVSALFYPEHWGAFYQAFRKGRKANHFHTWDFEQLLQEDISAVREKIFDKPSIVGRPTSVYAKPVRTKGLIPPVLYHTQRIYPSI